MVPSAAPVALDPFASPPSPAPRFGPDAALRSLRLRSPFTPAGTTRSAGGRRVLEPSERASGGVEVVAASMELPATLPPGEVDAALRDILREGAAAQDATIVSEDRVTRGGISGYEVRAKIRDGYDARLMVLSSGATSTCSGSTRGAASSDSSTRS